MNNPEPRSRRQLVKAALKIFADRGYAGSSVQGIVDRARVTKPTLYYYFGSKSGLYQALVDQAFDERYRLMQDGAGRGRSLEAKLEGILGTLFEYLQHHRESMRIAFATSFAAPGELPGQIQYLEKSRRNFEFVHSLIRQGLAERVLDRRFNSEELAFGIYGLLNVYVMAHLILPDCPLDRETARRVVRLYLNGAVAKK